MVEQDVSIDLNPMEQEEERLNTEVDAQSDADAQAASKEEQLKSDIAFNIASAILHCMRNTFNDNSIYGDDEKSDYIQRIVKNRLKTISPITEKHVTEIFKLIEKMKITLAQKNLTRMEVEYTFTFDLHDSKGLLYSDYSKDRCRGISIFIDLIKNLKDLINDKNTESKLLFKRISKVNSIVVSAEITYSGSSLQESISLCRTKKLYGGSKSRRKPARKTLRRRTRKTKSKSKSKTHRRRRHSRVRKHKKNLYTRRR